jgi:CYTH domain-containing protein
MEIERKFLPKLLPENLESYPHHKIAQGYLSTNPVVRIRRQDDEYILTYKGKGAMVREEYNLPLTREAFEHMVPKADGRFIQKTRYLIPYNQYTIELDVFHGDLVPLTLAEVELSSENEVFERPEWLGEEVSSDPRYRNSQLLPNPYKKW